MTTTPVLTANVPVPRDLLAALAATAQHVVVKVDPIDHVRKWSDAMSLATLGGLVRGFPMTVSYAHTADCPPCAAQRLLEGDQCPPL